MKKVFSILAMAAFMFAAFNANAQLGFNIGFAPETFTTKTTIGNSETTTTSDMNGFFAGVHFNTKISGDLALSIGGNVRLNMDNDEATVLTVTTKTSETQLLVDVPVLFNYTLGLSKDISVGIYAGPMVSYAINGSTKVTTHSSVTSILDTETETDWYGDNTSRERLNLSGMAGVMIGFQQFRLYGGYRIGLLDLNKNDNVKTTTSGLFVGLGLNL